MEVAFNIGQSSRNHAGNQWQMVVSTKIKVSPGNYENNRKKKYLPLLPIIEDHIIKKTDNSALS